MKIKLSILLVGLAVLSLWRCQWDLDKVDFVEVIMEADPGIKNVLTLELQGELKGLVNGKVVEHGHIWSSKTESPTFEDFEGRTELGEKNANGLFFSSVNVKDHFSPDRLYHFRAYARTEDNKTVYSSSRSFKTGALNVVTGTPIPEGLIEFSIKGMIQNFILGEISNRGHIWALSENLLHPDNIGSPDIGVDSSGSSISNGDFISRAAGLIPDTTYYVRAFARIGNTSFLADEIANLKTGTITVITGTPNSITKKIDGVITGLGSLKESGYSVSAYGHVWKQGMNTPTLSDEKSEQPGPLERDTIFPTELPNNLEGLYSFRAYAVLEGPNGYSKTKFGNVERATITGSGFWTKVDSDFPGLPRSGAVAFVIGNTAYVGLGDITGDEGKKFYKFNGNTTTWSDAPDFLGLPRSGAVAFVIGDTAYVGLGNITGDEGKKFYKFDGITNTWSDTTSVFPGPPRSGAVAFVIGNTAYVGLGDDDDDKYFYQYTPSSGWNIYNLQFTYGVLRGAVALVLEDAFSNRVAYFGIGENQPKLWRFAGNYFPQHNMNTDPFPGGGRNQAVGFSLGNNNTGYIGMGSMTDKGFWKFEGR